MCEFLCNILNKLDPKCIVVLAVIWLPLHQCPSARFHHAVRHDSVTPEDTQV